MTEVIGVRFRGGCKEYYFDPHGIAVEAGQFVIVETAQGTEYAQCLTGNHEVDDGAVVRPLRALVRIATENDRRTMEYNRQREKDAFGICQRKIAERGLDMKLVRVECSFDGSKIVFFFTSEGRVGLPRARARPRGRVPRAHRAASDRRARRGQDARAASASAAVRSAARSFWTILCPCPSRWPRHRISA